MNKVMAQLKPSDQGSEVANLQDALGLLIDRGRLVLDPAIRDTLLKDFEAERAQQAYADKATTVLVGLFQGQYRLKTSGVVDTATADALNKVLKELGGLEGDPP